MIKDKVYNVDIDGILCEQSDHKNYRNAVPKSHVIETVNNLYSTCTINIFTARLEADREDTEYWLKKNNVQYDKLIMDKPSCDLYIDDRAINCLPYIRERTEKDELVICVSGGLDSSVAYKIAQEKYDKITCLFFNVNQPYLNKEREVLKNLGIPFKEIDLSFYKDIAMVGHIIPNRNSLFANIGALFGNRIWIVGLKYEDHYLMHDKNSNFYTYVSLSLTQSTGRHIVVETPFSRWTKTDILDYCTENDLLDFAEKTTSCYHETEHRCGECSLCFRRWVAEQVAGVNIPFAKNPANSKERLKLEAEYRKALKEQNFTHYSKERIKETLEVIKNHDYDN